MQRNVAQKELRAGLRIRNVGTCFAW